MAKISEEVFISIKQGLYHSDRLMEIFEEMGYLNEEQEEVEIPEKDFRYLLLAVMNYLGKRPEKSVFY